MGKEKERENDAIVFLGNIQTAMRSKNIAMLLVVIASVIIALGSYAMASKQIDRSASQIYVVDDGSVMWANRANNNAQRDLEIEDHVVRLHELLFNLVPNIESIRKNNERAAEMGDGSIIAYTDMRSEKKYYTSLVEADIFQEISIDSISVNVKTYPYKVDIQASLYVKRKSVMTYYTMHSTCKVQEAERTHNNPHGLLVTEFHPEQPKQVGRKLINN